MHITRGEATLRYLHVLSYQNAALAQIKMMWFRVNVSFKNGQHRVFFVAVLNHRDPNPEIRGLLGVQLSLKQLENVTGFEWTYAWRHDQFLTPEEHLAHFSEDHWLERYWLLCFPDAL